MNSSYDFLLIYATCFPVKGAKNSIIIDTERMEIYKFSSKYFDYIEMLSVIPYRRLLENAQSKEIQIEIEELCSFLIQNDLAFFTATPSRFPHVKKEWKSATLIHNAIIDIDELDYSFDDFIIQLINVGCKHIQFRVFSSKPIDYYYKLLQNEVYKRFVSIEFVIKYHKSFTSTNIKELILDNQHVCVMCVHSVPQGALNDIQLPKGITGNLIVLNYPIKSSDSCGKISIASMTIPEMRELTRNRIYNSCLHGKISVDINGYVKNCPSMIPHYGYIDSASIIDIIQSDTFLRYGNICKDKITTCQDCEFRYICNDCRAYTINNNINEKPLKCKYNPYNAEWAD